MSFYKTKSKQIIADKTQIRDLVHRTISDMATIVGTTLGPGGNPVLIERDGLSPLVTKDGVTVAKNIGVADAAANTIVEAAKEICLNTAKEAGDGTTTAIVLADALVKEGQKFLSTRPKYNPQRMINELNDAYTRVVVPFLRDVAVKVGGEDQLRFVATISANGDREIADVVVKAVMDAGDDGTVLINESQGGKTYVEISEGYIVTTGLKDLGQIGPSFINDKANQQVKMDKGYVVLYDGSMNDLKVPGLIQDAVADDGGFSDGTPIIVFAHSFADSVLDKFAKTTKGGLTVVPIKTPRSGLPNGASMFLEDMAAYTGATVFNPGNAEEFDDEYLGNFDSARVNLYEAFITATPEGDAVNTRVVELKAIAESAMGELDRSFLRAAIAKLTGGVSTIHVGGASDLEIREKKARVEDAVEAVRSAIAEGIVTGGCSVHLILSRLLGGTHPDKTEAWSILADALQAPFKLLLKNCGEEYDEIHQKTSLYILEGANREKLPTYVFDANLHEMVDPMRTGIIEPAKVIRVSIGNALSVASLLTTLGGIIVVPRHQEHELQKELADQAFSSMMESVKNE
jgi:chaperonin GroEL